MGNKENSEKNIHLKNEDGSFKPAYMCPGIFENDSRGNKINQTPKSFETLPDIFLYITRKIDSLSEKVYFF